MFLGLVKSVEAIHVGESSPSSIISFLRHSLPSCVMDIYLQSVILRKFLVVITVLNNIMSQCYTFLGLKENP